MKAPKTYLIFTVLILLIIGCTPAKSDISNKLPSFRQYYPLLLKEAQNWRADAYLHDARIFLFPNSPDSYLISTGFYSISENSKSLAVDLLQNGTITSEIFIHKYPIYHHEPITENNWKIDSQEAIEYMLGKSVERFVNPDTKPCSFLVLKRVLPLQDQPVVWSLSLWDCKNIVQHLYMDANTGELLDSSAVNITPTRFPTPTP